MNEAPLAQPLVAGHLRMRLVPLVWVMTKMHIRLIGFGMILAANAMLPLGVCCQGPADPTTDLKSDVLEWVDQLDAPSLSARRSAERSLFEAGVGALEFLPESKSGISI